MYPSFFSLSFTAYGLLLAIGTGAAITWVGWKMGLSKEKTDLIKTLKIKVDILSDDNTRKDKRICELEDLLSYLDKKAQHQAQQYQNGEMPVYDHFNTLSSSEVVQ